ncbi:MAG: gamma-glutamyl-gamma-aminobutyrate hydrolase family protein [Gammaproteobacteria bacterium]|nr:gamma-glutamyl-gamma-aminobutyrate hydrolase family protein [Gammaproteobacteria bacterium]
MSGKPVILIPCDVKQVGIHPFHCVGEKYINAVAHGADAWPLLIPAFGEGTDLGALSEHMDIDALLDLADGVFLPGSVSNVAPPRYGAADDPGILHDVQRDDLALPLIELNHAGICRCWSWPCRRKWNVALGGTLHPRLQEVEGLMDHRENPEAERPDQYLPAHPVALTPGGRLEDLFGVREIQVNSLHGQGIRELAPGLMAEGLAPDGVVEAVSCPDYEDFRRAKWRSGGRPCSEDACSMSLFRAFGAAAAQWRQHRTAT